MRKLPRLYVVTLRYARYPWAVLVLASSYVSATALNDLVDTCSSWRASS